ncbi:MAG: hypothetical protein K6F53_12990 [Lachnospiraceae bacterium]|nr:hypothetical protein [Lachnospiraceae bacterium]
MRNLLLCTGEEARSPYYLKSMDANAFRIEEFCYLVAHNPYLVTDELMDPELAHWIGNECGLKDLSNELYKLLDRGCTLRVFIDAILDYVNYLDRNDAEALDEILYRNEGLNEYERALSQADYLFSLNRLESAIGEYEDVLLSLPGPEDPLRIRIFASMAEAYMGLFMFDVASRYFRRAYEASGEEDLLMRYLFCRRMQMEEDDYIRFLSEHRDYAEAAKRLEERLSSMKSGFEGTNERIRLEALKIFREEGNEAASEKELDSMIGDLKNEYLTMVTG